MQIQQAIVAGRSTLLRGDTMMNTIDIEGQPGIWTTINLDHVEAVVITKDFVVFHMVSGKTVDFPATNAQIVERTLAQRRYQGYYGTDPYGNKRPCHIVHFVDGERVVIQDSYNGEMRVVSLSEYTPANIANGGYKG